MRSITYIQGTREAGKTSLIKEVVSLMPDAIGVIADKCLDSEGAVAGYDAVLVPSGQRLPLCRHFQDEKFIEPHGRFFFDQTVFARVHEYILKNFNSAYPVIIDEIGSMEMKHHQGYYPTLAALMQESELYLILTIRG